MNYHQKVTQIQFPSQQPPEKKDSADIYVTPLLLFQETPHTHRHDRYIEKIMKSPPAQGAKFKRLYLSRGTKQKEAAIQVGKTQRMEGFEPLSFKALWDRKNGNFDSRSTANTTVFLLLDIEN